MEDTKIKTWLGSGQLWYATSQTPNVDGEEVKGVGYDKTSAILDYLAKLLKPSNNPPMNDSSPI